MGTSSSRRLDIDLVNRPRPVLDIDLVQLVSNNPTRPLLMARHLRKQGSGSLTFRVSKSCPPPLSELDRHTPPSGGVWPTGPDVPTAVALHESDRGRSRQA